MTAVITTQSELDAFCKRLARVPSVAVDTEFMRDKTYWPKLCLLQMAGPEEAAIVDPLAKGIDLAPVLKLMGDRKVQKVFHAARQDLEIFFNLMGTVPQPLFDTQVAAMVCGFGEQVSYETLVAHFVKTSLDKAFRFTDWAHRPLTERQLAYALGDVTHLRTIHAGLAEQTKRSGREEWLAEEMAVLTDPETYRLEPENAWERIKTRSGSARFFAVLKEVAARMASSCRTPKRSSPTSSPGTSAATGNCR